MDRHTIQIIPNSQPASQQNKQKRETNIKKRNIFYLALTFTAIFLDFYFLLKNRNLQYSNNSVMSDEPSASFKSKIASHLFILVCYCFFLILFNYTLYILCFCIYLRIETGTAEPEDWWWSERKSQVSQISCCCCSCCFPFLSLFFFVRSFILVSFILSCFLLLLLSFFCISLISRIGQTTQVGLNLSYVYEYGMVAELRQRESAPGWENCLTKTIYVY